MKVLLNICSQPRPYADSEGVCVIRLDEGDDADAIIKDYTRERAWWEQTYKNPRRAAVYERKIPGAKSGIIYAGDLIIFDTHREYVD